MKSGSLPSNLEQPLSRRDVLIMAGAVVFALAVFLAVSAYSYRIGFPLDDSWIHQTYARNLALRGEWSFLPGQPSGGSTSPLWTVLLAPGFWVGLSPLIWAFLLGAGLLFGLGMIVEQTLRRVVVSYRPSYPWAGLLFILEWHLAWAAFSGMETLLYILLVIAVCGMLLTGSRRYLLMGIVCGASVWVRPDGLTLLGPLALFIVLNESTLSKKISGLTGLVIGFAALFAPYLFFNLAVAGTPMPNTFYAKQAEYADWQVSPFSQKLLFFSLQFFSGVAVALLPGFVQALRGALRKREWTVWLLSVWLVGYAVLYVSRLPVYQHGRYVMPALAVFLMIGLKGWLENSSRATRNGRVMSKVLTVLLALVLLVSFAFGAYSYGIDVALIESQMVETALWVNGNVPAGALVAAHDIGALGYFSRVGIIDLAGLISPEVVPFITDDIGLANYMGARNVDYFIAFSGWHPALVARGDLVFHADSKFLPRSDLGNMAVYRWNNP